MRKQKENFTSLKAKLKVINEQKVNDKTQVSLKKPTKQQIAEPKVEVSSTQPSVSSSTSSCIIKLVPKNIVDDAVHLEPMFKLSQQRFRDEYLKSLNDGIAYVDMDKNTYKIFIRCQAKDTTKSTIDSLSSLNLGQQFHMSVLEGREESEYLNRIELNRNKLQMKKEKKLRGKSKVNDF